MVGLSGVKISRERRYFLFLQIYIPQIETVRGGKELRLYGSVMIGKHRHDVRLVAAIHVDAKL